MNRKGLMVCMRVCLERDSDGGQRVAGGNHPPRGRQERTGKRAHRGRRPVPKREETARGAASGSRGVSGARRAAEGVDRRIVPRGTWVTRTAGGNGPSNGSSPQGALARPWAVESNPYGVVDYRARLSLPRVRWRAPRLRS